MLEIKENDALAFSDDIFLQKISELGKYWVFNISTGEHYSLNETSYWILEKIADKVPLQSILTSFLSSFDVGEDEGRSDFNDIINNFINEGVIQRREK
jgi:hypothetical protein